MWKYRFKRLFVVALVFFGVTLSISKIWSGHNWCCVIDGFVEDRDLIKISFTRMDDAINDCILSNRHAQLIWTGRGKCDNFIIRRAEPGSLKPTALASYPGSGNTWVRWLIEAASGISTGSVYEDFDLYLHGFKGELLDWRSGETVVQKTHNSSLKHIQSFSNGKGIFISRNPYDALIAFHNFLYDGHVGYAPISNYKRKEWIDFLMVQARLWLVTASNWISNSSALLIVHYEELKIEPLPELRKMLRFLRVPVDEQRLKCIENYPRDNFNRKKLKQEEWDADVVFPKKWREIMDRVIRYVDFISQKFGHSPLPLEHYKFYDSSRVQTEIKDSRFKLDPQKAQSLLESVYDKFLSLAFWDIDPLTWISLQRRRPRRAKLMFDPEFPESTQLDLDFNH